MRIRDQALALLCAMDFAAAQGGSANAVVDSATAARAAYRRAVQAKDLAVAHREIERAGSAWPTQQAYVWGRAIIAAQAKDTAGTLSALRDYADLGLGRDLSSVAAFDFLKPAVAFKSVVERHDANRRPIAASRVVLRMDDPDIWPEGIAHDPRTGSYYITSVRHGTIWRIGATASPTPLWRPDSLRLGALLAVHVDTGRRVLWATTSGMAQNGGFAPADSAVAALLEIELTSGRILRQWRLPVVPRGHVLGDVVVGPKGDVFFSDSNHPVVYRLAAGADTLSAITSSLFNSVQGVAPTPDGKALYLADYSHGLIRVDLATRQATRLIDAPKSTSLGIDGIVMHDNAIIAVQNGVSPARIVRFRLDHTGTRIVSADILDRNAAVADEPTIGVVVGDEFVYVANSQWEKRDANGRARAGAVLTGPVLLGVRIR